jgi:LCP family protein required for cell wall assembly
MKKIKNFQDLQDVQEMPANTKKRMRTLPKVLLILLVLILLVLAIGTIILMKTGVMRGITGEVEKEIVPFVGIDGEIAQEFPDSKRINILLLGETKEELTDTMMLASFDTDLKILDLFSLPRDTYYEREDYPGAALQKLNSVYKTEGIKGAGVAVSELLGGVPIHFYAIIKDEGVKKVVDSMGGVKINVPLRMKYDDNANGLHIDILPGEQVLDGEHAVQFIRFRSGYREGDLGRVKAQQEFMKQAFKQSIGLGFPKVAATVIREVNTNLQPDTATFLAKKAIGMKSSDLETIRTVEAVDSISTSRASYFHEDLEKTAELVRERYSMIKEDESEKTDEKG